MTIHIKVVEQHFQVVLFVFDSFQNEIQDFPLSFEPSTCGSERIFKKLPKFNLQSGDLFF